MFVLSLMCLSVGSKLVTAIKFELFSLYEVQQQIRQLSYFNLTGRLRLTVQLARITLQIPVRTVSYTNYPQTHLFGVDGDR